MELRAEDFGNEFVWGVSSAAFQVEGASLLHGKGPSIWDDFTQRKGRILNNDNASISCDLYNKFPQDLALMRSMNIRHYRFSISWSRIFPAGSGAVNKKGVDFYNRMIDFCLELEIEPWITLYHWDLPSALEKKGGWTNREIIHWFSEYVSFCVHAFGDRVKHWMVLNEPLVFTGAGYFLGIHAPGRKGLTNFLPAAHHAALCQAEGGRIIRSAGNAFKIGTTFSCSHVDPQTNEEPDVFAAARVDTLLNRLFIEPLLGAGYPHRQLKLLQRMEPFIKDGDESRLQFDMDFIGMQNYTREVVAHSYFIPLLNAKIIKPGERNVQSTAMNWEVYPPSIYHMLKRFGSYKNIPEILVTENGAAFNDVVEQDMVNDIERKKYLHKYLEQVLKAKNEGVNVNGYFVWSFTDNFEWAEGFRPRFGIVHVDFSTQKRIVKSSGLWYKRFLSSASQHSLSRLADIVNIKDTFR